MLHGFFLFKHKKTKVQRCFELVVPQNLDRLQRKQYIRKKLAEEKFNIKEWVIEEFEIIPEWKIKKYGIPENSLAYRCIKQYRL